MWRWRWARAERLPIGIKYILKVNQTGFTDTDWYGFAAGSITIPDPNINMNTKFKTAAIAAFLAISVSVYADSYIRPELLWSRLKLKADAGFEALKPRGAGVGIVGGQTFGAQGEHISAWKLL